jgi:hypothetical protein
MELLSGGTRAVENFSGPRARVLAVVDHNPAVCNYEINLVGRHIGMRISGAVLDFVVVEDHYVRSQAFVEQAAVGDARPCGRPGGHLSDGILERERMRFADVARDCAENFRS